MNKNSHKSTHIIGKTPETITCHGQKDKWLVAYSHNGTAHLNETEWTAATQSNMHNSSNIIKWGVKRASENNKQ